VKRITDIVANALLLVAGTLITISTVSLLIQPRSTGEVGVLSGS